MYSIQSIVAIYTLYLVLKFFLFNQQFVIQVRLPFTVKIFLEKVLFDK